MRSPADVMQFGIVGEDEVAMGFVHPVVFWAEWRGSGFSPERELAVTMIAVAAEDLRRYRFAKYPWWQRAYWETYEWVASNDRTWPFSFVNLCEYCRIDVGMLRRALLDGDTRQWGSFGMNARVEQKPLKAA